MTNKIKEIFSSWRIWLVLICVVLSLIQIAPNLGREGVAIRSVDTQSAAELGGLSASSVAKPSQREIITEINGNKISDIDDYYEIVNEIEYNDSVRIQTNRQIYQLTAIAQTNITILPELEEITVVESILNNDTQEFELVNVTRLVNKTLTTITGTQDLGLTVFNAPKTNILLGLDFQGGTRVILKPEVNLEDEELELLIQNMEDRLNVFGLSDVKIRSANDLAGDQFVVVEIAGINEDEIKDLLAQQGKFEAKIAEETVFKGTDVRNVCLSGECAGIDPYAGCQGAPGEVVCRYRFTITLSQEAAQRQAAATARLSIVPNEFNPNDARLSEPIDLFLDDELVSSLQIGADLKGRAIQEVSVSGSGIGIDQRTATQDALNDMKRMQSILKTGSLPVKLDVVNVENVSAFIGAEFFENAQRVALASLITVIVILLFVYRKPVVSVPIIVTSLFELIILLGVAVIIKWNFDLAAIAGIIAAIGTGVNDQVIIADEALRGEKRQVRSWEEKSKNAFFIIIGAFLTMLVAMVPLLFAGAGLLRGFAVTTIIGITIGVLITRPAYAKFVQIILK